MINETKMDFNLENTAIVIVAQSHNPTILNPDFLYMNKIVPLEWHAQNPICTPPLAVVEFQEGFRILSQFDRIEFLDKRGNLINKDTPLINVAKNYIEVISHVPYKAVGLNFLGFLNNLQNIDAGLLLNEKFLSLGPWKENNTGCAIKIFRQFENFKFTLSVDPAQKVGGSPSSVIAISANFHSDIDLKNVLDSVKSLIDQWGACLNFFNRTIKIFFNLGGQNVIKNIK